MSSLIVVAVRQLCAFGVGRTATEIDRIILPKTQLRFIDETQPNRVERLTVTIMQKSPCSTRTSYTWISWNAHLVDTYESVN